MIKEDYLDKLIRDALKEEAERLCPPEVVEKSWKRFQERLAIETETVKKQAAIRKQTEKHENERSDRAWRKRYPV